jgi:hypothetical protein
MSRAKSLIDRCLDNIAPEPVAVVMDESGTVHFATDAFPLRTLIDIYGIAYLGDWLKIDELCGTVRLEADGRVAVYRRVARDIHGAWICNLDRGDKGADVQEQVP